MADQTDDSAHLGERNSLDLDALAVSDRFRLFNFTRRDDHVAYLWVLRALDRLRGVHQVQAHTDDVATALAELAAVYDEAPRLDGSLREKLDALAAASLVHRLPAPQPSADAFRGTKSPLAAQLTDFMAELARYLPRLSAAVGEAEAAAGAPDARLRLAAEADERPFLGRDELLADWRRRWAALRAWFADDAVTESKAAGLRTATPPAVSRVIALPRQVPEAQRRGVNRSSQLRHLAEWVFNTPDEGAAYALMSGAFNIRSARHLGGAHDDDEQISSRATWWDAPGVEISVTLFRRGKAPTPGVPQPTRSNPALRAELRRRQAAERHAEREAAARLLQSGAHVRVLDDAEMKVLLRLLTLATEARTGVAGPPAASSGGNDLLTMRLIPNDEGSA